jgi:hypothetical protein
MKGQGSMFTLEFGKPHLAVQEPYHSESLSPRILAMAARRHVRPAGEWTLWIYSDCRWSVAMRGERLADNEGDYDAIRAALRELDGQKLVGVMLDLVQRMTIFNFDLGGTLVASSDSDHKDQWMLFMPNGSDLSYRASGCYSLENSKSDEDERSWLNLPSEPLVRSVGVLSTSPGQL